MFIITERELGVTRLLDPEDVDTPKPDEKSIITYVSSLYELFPDPNPRNPLMEDEKIRRIEEYRDSAMRLVIWISESTARLKERRWPNSIQELKMVQTDHNRFRTEEIPPKLHEKQRLAHSYREATKLSLELDCPIHIDHELSSDNIEVLWNRMIAAHQDRDQALMDEILRIEKMQRLAEKLIREMKHCNARLDEIEVKILDEEKKVQRMETRDIKFNCEQIAADLRIEGERIQNMMQDVETLREGRFERAHELQTHVEQLHQRWSEMGFILKTRVIEMWERRKAELEAGIQEQFQMRVTTVTHELQILEETVDRMGHPEREIALVERQMRELKEVEMRLKKAQNDLDETVRFCNENIPDSRGHKSTFDALYKQASRIDTKIRQRHVALNDALDRLQTFYERLTELSNELHAAVNQEASFRSVGRDVETIRSQQQELKTFIRTKIEPLSRQGEEVTRTGNHLIQSAGPGVSTIKIGRDMEEVINTFAQLKDKISQREQKLNIALLHFGQMKDYVDGATKLLRWIEECTSRLKERKWPNTIQELKMLQTDHNRFRTEEIPPRVHEKQRLLHTFREASQVAQDLGVPVHVDRELTPDNIDMMWNRMISAHQERDQDLIEEILRVEKMQRLAEKLMRDIKHCESRLDDVDKCIMEEEKRVQRIESRDAKTNCDQIENDLRVEGERIQAMMQDMQPLHEGRYHAAGEIQSRIDQLHRRWTEMGLTFRTRVVEALNRRLAQLEAGIHDKFNFKLNGVQQELQHLEDMIDRMGPPEREVPLIERQIKETREVEVRLKKVQSDLDETIRFCNENLPDSKNYRSSFDEMFKQSSRIDTKIRQRITALNEALDKLHRFYDGLTEASNELHAVSQEATFNSVGPDAEAIRGQQQELKSFIRAKVEPLSRQGEEVTRAGNELIQTAGVGVSTHKIGRDIEEFIRTFSDLKDKLNDFERKLNAALKVAQKFWDELDIVMKTLQELQDTLNEQEPPAAEPSAISQQQLVLGEIRQEMDCTQPEIEDCKKTGRELIQLVTEPEKPEVRKQIEELDQAWETVTSLYAKREHDLATAMEKAMNFHEILQGILDFLDLAEARFDGLGPIGADIETVKRQMVQLRDFKSEVDPHMIEIETLNRRAQILLENTSPHQVRAIREPLEDINRRWSELCGNIVDRQNELESALLRLGQFQHALDEMLQWMAQTEAVVRDIHPVSGDLQQIEMELAKLKVTMTDIDAHQSSIDTLNEAGRLLLETDKSNANSTQQQLRELNSRYSALRNLALDKQRELERMLDQASSFNREVQELLMWMSDVDAQLGSSKPVGGLPETAREQLNRFMELYNEIEVNRSRVESVLSRGSAIIDSSPDGAANLQLTLKSLKQRWDHILNRANDRKIKLGIALREATEFAEAMQEFQDWLSGAERHLTNLQPVSRIMDHISRQIEEHKDFQKDVSAHRDTMLALDKKGTHLKYFSQKQDVILIKNMMVSVQHRWERVVAKTAERSRALEQGLREAKEFFEAWGGLMEWLRDAEDQLDSVHVAGNTPDKIKAMLAKHKEFQRALGAKQGLYDATMKAGRALKEKAPRSDAPVLQDMMDQLKNKWNSVCSKSVDRQRKLEESLLFSGQFRDAVDALIDWLEKARIHLDLDRLHGDLDTVTSLVDQHKAFQEDFRSRAKNLASVRKTAQELLQTASADDAVLIRQQMESLESRWEEVSQLSVEKERRLQDALRQAEKLHKSVHGLLEWLSDAEMKLRFTSALPDDEASARQHELAHERFMQELSQQERNKDATIALAHEILAKCHPDAVATINHWISIIQSRWEEVCSWARKREERLRDHLASLKDITDLLDQLLTWIRRKESELHAVEAIPIPDDIPTIERLIDEHQHFMDDMTARQSEVDRVAKTFSVKRSAKEETPGRRGLRTPTQSAEGEIRNPRARELLEKWQHVWTLAVDRMRRLQDRLAYANDLERMKNFDFEEWRRRFLAWLNNKKARVMDFYRKIDTDNDCRVTQNEFIEGFLRSKFPTSRLEMERVAAIFDRNSDGYIDHKEYLETLRANRDFPRSDDEIIMDEVQRQVAKCTCTTRYKVFHVGEGKYRFGESQKLRLVRILRSTVMVRVGGGWVSLDEFLIKNDPCRGKSYFFGPHEFDPHFVLI